MAAVGSGFRVYRVRLACHGLYKLFEHFVSTCKTIVLHIATLQDPTTQAVSHTLHPMLYDHVWSSSFSVHNHVLQDPECTLDIGTPVGKHTYGLSPKAVDLQNRSLICSHRCLTSVQAGLGTTPRGATGQ